MEELRRELGEAKLAKERLEIESRSILDSPQLTQPSIHFLRSLPRQKNILASGQTQENC